MEQLGRFLKLGYNTDFRVGIVSPIDQRPMEGLELRVLHLAVAVNPRRTGVPIFGGQDALRGCGETD